VCSRDRINNRQVPETPKGVVFSFLFYFQAFSAAIFMILSELCAPGIGPTGKCQTREAMEITTQKPLSAGIGPTTGKCQTGEAMEVTTQKTLSE